MFKPTIKNQTDFKSGILIVDVDYRADGAYVAGVIIPEWDSPECAVLSAKVTKVAEYVPGEFYKRELPCIQEILKQVAIPLTHIVVDGYAVMGPDLRQPGLGLHLFDSLKPKIPVIGVAKRPFHDTSSDTELYRACEAANPLYVTAVGMNFTEAKSAIHKMHGDFRIPSMLKYVDHLCRNNS